MQSHLLIVEPEPDIACLLRLLFDPPRFVVRCAEDLRGARAALAQLPPPDLIILDPFLPDGDGLALCRELRVRRPALPILVLTTQAQMWEAALAAGASRFMMKPFEPGELEAAVTRLCRGGPGSRYRGLPHRQGVAVNPDARRYRARLPL